jgi:hypothetical protein
VDPAERLRSSRDREVLVPWGGRWLLPWKPRRIAILGLCLRLAQCVTRATCLVRRNGIGVSLFRARLSGGGPGLCKRMRHLTSRMCALE